MATANSTDDGTLAKHVDDFLTFVRNYLRAYQHEQHALNMLQQALDREEKRRPEDGIVRTLTECGYQTAVQIDTEKLLEAQRRRGDSRNDVMNKGEALAQVLEFAGHDALKVRLAIECVRPGFVDVDRLRRLQPELAAELGRLNLQHQTKVYPCPKHYARDEWIYKKFGTVIREELSLELKIQSESKKWRPISSPNGIELAAKRYAKFHNLPWPKS